MTPPPAPGLTDKLTDALIKLLMMGSGSSAIYFLYVNELPKAAIAALISAGAALITSFGEGLMDRLKGGMKRQGERVGEATTEAVGSARDVAWAKLSGLSKQYQEALKAYCYAVEIEGFQDLPGLALADVFVPLRIESAQYRLGLTTRPQEIWEFLPRRDQAPAKSLQRRIVILAAPGYGKTTLLRHLTLTFVTQPPEDIAELMPILLRFREVHSLMRLPQGEGEMARSLPDLVVAHLKDQPEFQHARLSKAWVTEQLTKGRCLVMLDGLDEVPKGQRQRVRLWVDQQMKTYKNTQFLLTSRPHGFELQPDDPSHPIAVDLKLRVLDFTPDQKQDFVEKWYRTLLWRLNWQPLLLDSQQRAETSRLAEAQARLKSDQEAQAHASDLIRQIVTTPALNDLARNPLLITMIASTHRAKTVLPKRRVELYDKIFDLLLGTRPYTKQTMLTLSATENKAVLQALAWNLVSTEKTQFTPQQGNAWIAEPLKRCLKDRALTQTQFWQEMKDIAGFLTEKELGKYEFTHQTFQEYLAALYLRELGDVGEAVLLEQLKNDRWQEVIRFYVALGDATPIINALLEKPDEYALALAKKCRDEARGVAPDTLERLQQAIAHAQPQRLEPEVPCDPVAISAAWFSALSAEVQLERRFQNLRWLNDQTEITSDFITWAEYRLFLEAQQTGQFHSKATLLPPPPGKEKEPVKGMKREDARWFCAWLSTQTSLQAEGKVVHYRLPTVAELEAIDFYTSALRDRDDESAIVALSRDFYNLPKPWTDRLTPPGNAILVVREELPLSYGALLNYLANGRWKEANQATEAIMRTVAGRDAAGYLRVEDIQKIPFPALQIIDRLWVKFSGGIFGFSVQKRVYGETGNRLNGQYHEKAWEQFCEALGWYAQGAYRSSSELTFSLEAPLGHLPQIWGDRSADLLGGCPPLLSRRDLQPE